MDITDLPQLSQDDLDKLEADLIWQVAINDALLLRVQTEQKRRRKKTKASIAETVIGSTERTNGTRRH